METAMETAMEIAMEIAMETAMQAHYGLRLFAACLISRELTDAQRKITPLFMRFLSVIQSSTSLSLLGIILITGGCFRFSGSTVPGSAIPVRDLSVSEIALPFDCPDAAPMPIILPAPLGSPPFYSKYLDAGGIPILASGHVCDRTLQVAQEIVLHMLSKRTDLLRTLSESGAKVAIFAVSEKLTDLPENQDLTGVSIDPTRKWDNVCGSGGVKGRPTAICERNLINVQDPYFGLASIFIHEFGHTIQNIALDSTANGAVLVAYSDAQKAALFQRADTHISYMMSNSLEFFAEGSSDWFNASDPTNPACSPEQSGRDSLKLYDPEFYQVLSQIYPDDNWVYPRG